ncbi:hypothetical protein VP01_314g1 [Puccinia sorghi]|uniref:WW domain-containing protein n=1 Tax=Puccinia sorghi TaxID=27349 RepID=A0A0L6V0R2_9BASI|nr:hypothetical protein VP01_314g1 [Puccinia sorghi]
MNIYSQQSYGLLHPVHPHSSIYPAGPSWPQQSQQIPQPSQSTAGPMNDSSLPPGWLKQWNPQYQTWFFVNTYAQPAISQWIHPAHSLPVPAGPPPMMGGGMAMSQLAPRLDRPAAPAASYGTAAPVAPAMERQVAFVPATQQPSSKGAGILAAGAGAMGGLALGGLLSHEWKEHQLRQHNHVEHEQQRENQAYNAGLEQAELQRDYALNHNNYHAFGDSADNFPYQEANLDLSYGDDGEWE